MDNDIIQSFQLMRQTFGVCPDCGDLFRLSDCNIFLKGKRSPDWLDNLEKKEKQILEARQKLILAKHDIAEQARGKGRQEALSIARTIDPIFTPKGLDPRDARVICHPIDYLVFDGMQENTMNRILFLDRQRPDTLSNSLQTSIAKTIESGNYEWRTVRVQESGSMTVT